MALEKTLLTKQVFTNCLIYYKRRAVQYKRHHLETLRKVGKKNPMHLKASILKWSLLGGIAVLTVSAIFWKTKAPGKVLAKDNIYSATVIMSSNKRIDVKIDSVPKNTKHALLRVGSNVILNASDAILTDANGKKLKPSDLKHTDIVTIELTEPPIMTRSIPPQISGDSIKQLTRVSE